MAAANTDKFKKAKRRFSTTVGVGGFTAGATTLPLSSTSGLDTDTAITLVLEPGTANEEVITGVVNGSNVINCVRGKEGTTDVTHTAGSAVSMYFTETHWDDLINGILVAHNQDGTLANNVVDTSNIVAESITNSKLSAQLQKGWVNLGDAPDTITYNGNRNYDLVYNGVDLTSSISPGMKMRFTRTVAAPTQCADLESGSSQYFSAASPQGCTFTDDFTLMAWIKMESYATTPTIVSRYNGTSGWRLHVENDGRVTIRGYSGGSTNYRSMTSNISLPLGKWIHVAATLDMSTYTAASSPMYFDGVSVDVTPTQSGTNPTSLTQAGNIQIGNRDGGTVYFDGEIAQVGIFSAILSASTIKSYISQSLSGTATSLVSGYTLSNSLNDLNTTNANNLTANGSATTTTADSPFANAVSAGTEEYAEVNTISYSTNTTINVRVPDVCMIPTTDGITNSYSAVGANPYGLPVFKNIIADSLRLVSFVGTGTSAQDVTSMTISPYVPANKAIKLTFYGNVYNTGGGGTQIIYLMEGSTVLAQGKVVPGAANNVWALPVETIIYPTSGTHTYKVQLSGTVSGPAIECSITEPSLFKAEIV